MNKSFTRLKQAFFPELNLSDLSTIIKGMDASHNIDKRMTAMKSLMAWMRLPTPKTIDGEETSHIHSKNLRFKFFLQFIERNPSEAALFIEMLREILTNGSAIRLYYLTGVSENNGFFSELMDRTISGALPRVHEERDLAELFRMVFTEKEDAEWFDLSYKLILPPILELIETHKIETENLARDMDDALLILGAQISSLGITKGIRKRFRIKNLSLSPFVILGKIIVNAQESESVILKEVSNCQHALQIVRESLEMTGVSVDLIYDIERITSLLQRVEMLVYLRSSSKRESREVIVSHFIASLIRDEINRLSVRDFLSEHVQMLTKKIVERSGEKSIHLLLVSFMNLTSFLRQPKVRFHLVLNSIRRMLL